MNSKEKREEVVALIDNIKEHSDRLSKMPHMPLLEVSAILSKINRLNENTAVLKYLLSSEQDHHDEEIIIDARKTGEKPDLEEDDLDVDVIDEDHEVEDEDEDEDEEIELDSKKIDEIEAGSGISSKADINEQYAEELEDRSLSEQLKKQPIADLLTAIGLNERYLYANDLFGGDIEEFRKAIRLLNEFDNEEAASRYFNEELRRAYGWEEDNELAEALHLLVKRRFQ